MQMCNSPKPCLYLRATKWWQLPSFTTCSSFPTSQPSPAIQPHQHCTANCCNNCEHWLIRCTAQVLTLYDIKKTTAIEVTGILYCNSSRIQRVSTIRDLILTEPDDRCGSVGPISHGHYVLTRGKKICKCSTLVERNVKPGRCEMTQKDDLAGNKERNKLKLHQIFLHRQKKKTQKKAQKMLEGRFLLFLHSANFGQFVFLCDAQSFYKIQTF